MEAFFNESVKAQFVNQLEKGEVIKIAALGTSLTGGTWRWFDVMSEWLDQDYPGQICYKNMGVGASASSYPPGNSGLDQVKKFEGFFPDVVFIEFAVNDAYIPYHISVEDSRANLETIIQTLKSYSPQVEIILQTMNVVIDMPELNKNESTKRSELHEYHKMYREVAKEHQLLLIDHFPNWERYLKEEGRDAYIKVVKDGIHPSLEGYRKILLPELKLVLQNKWLPENEKSSSISTDVESFLLSLNGHLRLLNCRYEDSRLTSSYCFRENVLKIEKQEWQSKITASPVDSDHRALELEINFQLTAGIAREAGVAVAFDFADWNPGNYVMLPASVYNGNRVQLVDRGYNAGLDRKFLYQKDIPLMSVPIPQLSPNNRGISRLEVNASNLATPAMCFFSKKQKRGFILLAEQKTPYADNGFCVEERPDRQVSSFVVCAPGVRERKPLFAGFEDSPDRGADFYPGDQINMRFRIYNFEAENIPAFLEEFMKVRKTLTGQNQPRNLFPFSQVASWMTKRIDDRWYADEKFQFYCPENANWISFGWVGGLMNTFPMLVLGDEEHRRKVCRTFDFAIPRGQGESGYFYGALNSDGECFSREGYPEIPEVVLTRKNADVLYWMIKQFILLQDQGNNEFINPSWEEHILKLADAFVSTWKKNGQWGRMLNNQTGEVAEYNTSGGVMAIGGLALASRYYGRLDYLEIAKEAARFYYQRDFFEQGKTTGGCADILQNADSETAAGFMTALMVLYEITLDTEWLEKSQNLATLCATWTTSYDYELPGDTELGRLDAKLAGIYWASTQNKHGAPGICTSSGDPLFKIFRHSGNKLFAELLNDIVHAHGESIRPGGFTNERLTYCDADSRGERGNHVTGWNELNGFLMALEIPGIYLQTDTDLFYVFDHIEVNLDKRDDSSVILEITNPTGYDANVSIFAESAEEADIPLGLTAFNKWPKVNVRAGECRVVKINSISGELH